MSRNRGLGIGLLLFAPIAAIGWWWSSSGSRLVAPGRAIDAVVATEAPTAPDVASALQAERATVLPPVAAEVPNDASPSPSDPASALADTRACVKGRLLLPDGSPAAGVQLKLHGWGANGDRIAQYGAPERWEDVSVANGLDGRFALRFDPPRAFQFTLDAKLDGHAGASWRWSEIAPGATVDVGDVTLRRAATIRGRMVDARGEALVGQEWRVHFEGAPSAPGGDKTRGSQAVDPATAAFVFTDVPPGSVKLTAYSGLANWIAGPIVEVRAGETTAADVVYPGPDLAQRITITLFSRPFRIFGHRDIDSIVVSGSGEEPRQASLIAGSSQSWCVDGVPPGSYTVEVRDRRMVPWKKEGVVPGTKISAHLEGNAAVQLEVVDAATGEPIPRYSLTVWFDEFQGSPNRFELLAAASPPPADGRFGGLIPTNQKLIMRAAGYAECIVPLHPLEPNEVRRVSARLDRGATLSGVVWHAGRRSPAPDTTVRLRARRGTDEGEEPAFRIRLGDGKESATVETLTDAEGRFRFDHVATGRYTLRAGLTPDLEAAIDDVEVPAGSGAIETLDLVLPPCGYVVGRLVAPPGASFEGMEVDVAQGNDATSAFHRYRRRHHGTGQGASVEADGRFRVGPLPAGDSRVLLQLPDITVPAGGTAVFGTPGPSIDLGNVVVPESGETAVEFDLRDRFPGCLKVSFELEGASAVGAVVQVRRRRPATGGGENGSAAAGEIDAGDTPALLAAGTIGADGVAIVDPIPVGVMELLVRSPSHEWAWWSDDPITVAPGAEVSVALAGRVVTGAVTIAGITASPEAMQFGVLLGRDHGDATDFVVQATPDAEGRLHLRLAPGKYRLQVWVEEGERTASFEWTENGANPSRVEMVIQR